MAKGRKTKGKRRPLDRDRYISLDRKIEESNNRQKLLKKLDPATRDFARREFAKLGLF